MASVKKKRASRGTRRERALLLRLRALAHRWKAASDRWATKPYQDGRRVQLYHLAAVEVCAIVGWDDAHYRRIRRRESERS